MISYELIMGLTVLGLIVIYGPSTSTRSRASSRVCCSASCRVGRVRPAVRRDPLPHAAIAENKRIPFDLPEAESELIAGYFTEYSAMKMGLFMFAEFIEIAIIGALFTTLFLGGYNLPYMTDAGSPAGGRGDRRAARRDRRDPARRVSRQGDAGVELPDPRPLVAAALSLGPAAALRVEVHVPARACQPARHRPSSCGLLNADARTQP
jgi:hypothetical protein